MAAGEFNRKIRELNGEKMPVTKLGCIDVKLLKVNAKKLNSCGNRARNKLRILRRDGFKCVNCGSRENLTIAHKDKSRRSRGRNSGCYLPKDCDTLCERCHLANEIRREGAL